MGAEKPDTVTARVSGLRAGVYVDVENIKRTGGYHMRFDTLRTFACRDGAEALRLNAYRAFDEELARKDEGYRRNDASYHAAVRAAGFKVIEKPVRWYTHEKLGKVSKANSDLDLAVDMLLQSAKLDRVVLVSADGDFARVVRAVQDLGCRVEVIAFEHVSLDLRRECDLFLSGHLVPNLLPQQGPAWGEFGSRVRGTCSGFQLEKGVWFLSYIADPALNNLMLTDDRQDDSPYREAIFRRNAVEPGFDLERLPSHNLVFEFTLNPPKGGRENKKQKPEATDVKLVADYSPSYSRTVSTHPS